LRAEKERVNRDLDSFKRKYSEAKNEAVTAYKGLEGIVQSQIIQLSPNKVIIKNVIDNSYTNDIEIKFKKNLMDRLGSNIELKFEYVDSIPLGKNGKFEAVKRKFIIHDSSNI
jgi:hypothetical protein